SSEVSEQFQHLLPREAEQLEILIFPSRTLARHIKQVPQYEGAEWISLARPSLVLTVVSGSSAEESTNAARWNRHGVVGTDAQETRSPTLSEI
ncbi:hypothetical protein GBAR_LOCUS30438, partial [Geodia barretti]